MKFSEKIPNQVREYPESLISDLVNWNKRLRLPERSIVESRVYQNLQLESAMPPMMKISDDVYQSFYKYHDALRNLIARNQNSDFDGNYGRFHDKALRIAALFASINNFESIELNHWAKAQAITERWRADLHELYHQLNDNNQYKRSDRVKDLPIEAQVLRAVEEKKKHDIRGITQATGFKKVDVVPALKKLVSEKSLLEINDNGKTRYVTRD